MSTTSLSNMQEVIERTLFERIRQELVDKSYLPDIADTGTYPDDDTGWAQWETAISSVVTAKGYAVEVFNAGISEAKGIKKIPRIVIDSGSFLPGALGGDPQRYFEDQGAKYYALVTPPQTVDYYVNIHLVAGSIEQIRILNSLLSIAVPRRGYLPFYNDATSLFFARNIGYYDGDSSKEGIIEKIFGYEIPDCWDAGEVKFNLDIVKMTEITLNTNVQKYMDRTWGYDSDPLVIT